MKRSRLVRSNTHPGIILRPGRDVSGVFSERALGDLTVFLKVLSGPAAAPSHGNLLETYLLAFVFWARGPAIWV